MDILYSQPLVRAFLTSLSLLQLLLFNSLALAASEDLNNRGVIEIMQPTVISDQVVDQFRNKKLIFNVYSSLSITNTEFRDFEIVEINLKSDTASLRVDFCRFIDFERGGLDIEYQSESPDSVVITNSEFTVQDRPEKSINLSNYMRALHISSDGAEGQRRELSAIRIQNNDFYLHIAEHAFQRVRSSYYGFEVYRHSARDQIHDIKVAGNRFVFDKIHTTDAYEGIQDFFMLSITFHNAPINNGIPNYFCVSEEDIVMDDATAVCDQSLLEKNHHLTIENNTFDIVHESAAKHIKDAIHVTGPFSYVDVVGNRLGSKDFPFGSFSHDPTYNHGMIELYGARPVNVNCASSPCTIYSDNIYHALLQDNVVHTQVNAIRATVNESEFVDNQLYLYSEARAGDQFKVDYGINLRIGNYELKSRQPNNNVLKGNKIVVDSLWASEQKLHGGILLFGNNSAIVENNQILNTSYHGITVQDRIGRYMHEAHDQLILRNNEIRGIDKAFNAIHFELSDRLEDFRTIKIYGNTYDSDNGLFFSRHEVMPYIDYIADYPFSGSVFEDWSPATIRNRNAFYVGDFDGDGMDDIARDRSRKGGIDIFLSNGRDSFMKRQNERRKLRIEDEADAFGRYYVADFNRDKKQDFLRIQDSEFTAFLSGRLYSASDSDFTDTFFKNSSRFAQGVTSSRRFEDRKKGRVYHMQAEQTVRSYAIVHGDVTHQDIELSGFNNLQDLDFSQLYFGHFDENRSSHSDLLVFGRGTQRPHVFVYDEMEQTYQYRSSFSTTFAPLRNRPSSYLVHESALVADYNGDGLTDIARRYSDLGGFVVYYNSDGRFRGPYFMVGLNTEAQGPQRYYPGDFNGDRVADIIVNAGYSTSQYTGAKVLLSNASRLPEDIPSDDEDIIVQDEVDDFDMSIFPNPVDQQATVEVCVDRVVDLQLKVYDLGGRLVQTLYSGNRPEGCHRYLFEAASLSSGVYLLNAGVGDEVHFRKLTVIR